MFSQKSEFFRHSKTIVESFLRSVVIVDDGGLVQDTLVAEAHGGMISPDRRPRSRLEEAKDDVLQEGDGKPTLPSGAGKGRFAAKTVIDSFARKRIVCSFLQPRDRKELDSLVDTLEGLAQCADIIIIDWDLHQDDGTKALESIGRIARLGSEDPARLRLIVIYTIEQDIKRISERVKVCVEQATDEQVIEEDDGFALLSRATRISVLSKEDSPALSQYDNRKVAFEHLADRVIEEFTAMTAGLVSNVVLEALAQIRRKTYEILSQFSRDLDAPYLTHRALLPCPSDAEEYLIELVVEELRGILEGSRVGQKADINAIAAWVTAMKLEHSADFSLKLSSSDPSLSEAIPDDRIIDVFTEGIEPVIRSLDRPGKSKKDRIAKNAHILPLTKTFACCCSAPELLDERFAFVTNIRSHYGHLPMLTLGTILKEVLSDQSRYWVCIQPRCDSLRIDGDRMFPFLPLRKVETGNKFNIVIKEGSGYLKFLISKKPYDIHLVVFSADEQTLRVTASKCEDGCYYFRDVQENLYRWMGELRPEQALRAVRTFADLLSRIGLDESEWLRRWATHD